ncbi:MAG: four helix bundle protein, partial [Deltaproteobacteria bacterium]|nr:four helix bundle protein [Deltaproteobacteria bacterium]
MGSNPTLSARTFNKVECHCWLVAVGWWLWVPVKEGQLTRFRFKSFRVYQDAKDYCVLCRETVQKHIEKRDKGLANQVGRSLNSIVLNIAEGSADNSDAEFGRFLGISIRSVYESVAGFDLAALHGYVDEDSNRRIEEEAHKLVKQLASF